MIQTTVFQKQCLLAFFGKLKAKDIDGIDGPITQAAEQQLKVAGVDLEAAGAALEGKVPVQPEETTGTFWDSVKWFRREEFRCKCGGRYCNGYPAEMQEDAVRIADAAREHFGRPAHVVSGLRCPKWNTHEGGVWNSQHQYGEAIDLRIEGVDSETLRQFVSQQKNHRYSYRINGTNVHFDIPARPR